MKPKYNKAILFSSFGIILSAGIASTAAACKDENNISSRNCKQPRSGYKKLK